MFFLHPVPGGLALHWLPHPPGALDVICRSSWMRSGFLVMEVGTGSATIKSHKEPQAVLPGDSEDQKGLGASWYLQGPEPRALGPFWDFGTGQKVSRAPFLGETSRCWESSWEPPATASRMVSSSRLRRLVQEPSFGALVWTTWPYILGCSSKL